MIDIAVYEQLFSEFLKEYYEKKTVLPEITDKILETYKAEKNSIFGALLYGFVGGFNRGLAVILEEEGKGE